VPFDERPHGRVPWPRSPLEVGPPALVYIKKALGLTPVDEYTINEIWIVMGRSNADCHNYFKIAYDCLESAGIVTDDKYLIPRVQGIGHDGKNPTIVMRLGAK